MIAYCMRCRKKQEMGNPQKITMKNGRPAYTAPCPECGCKMFAFSKGDTGVAVAPGRKKAVTPIEKLVKAADSALSLKPRQRQVEIKTVESEAPMEEPEAMGPISAQAKRKWKLIIPGLLLAILGISMMFLYGQHRDNVFFAFLTIMALPGGVYMLWKGWKGTESGIIITEGGEEAKTTGPVNSLNIYRDRIAFEYVREHKGQPQQCLNDGKYYYVHKFNPETETLEQFTLPDQYDYYDPREYANVLMVRAWRRLNERIASLWQKVAPGVLVIAIIVSGIIFIATTGGE